MSPTSNHGRIGARMRGVYWFPTLNTTLNTRRTVRLVCTPRILAGVSLEVGATSLTRRIPEACSWRLTVFAEGYAASDEEELPQILTLFLTIREMVATGPGPRLILMSLFHTMKTIITNGGVRFHPAKVWVTML